MRALCLPFGLLVMGASPPAAQKLDLTTCIRRALERSPDMRGAAADLAAAQAHLDEARWGRLGQFELTQILGLVNRARGNVIYSPDSKNAVLTGLGPFTRVDLAISIPLYTFGRIGSAIEAAEHGVASEKENGRRMRADVVLDTKRLYYEHILVRELLPAVQDLVEAMEKAVTKAEDRLRSGDKSVQESDVLKLRLGRAKLAKGLFELQSAVALTRSALARAIGEPQTSNFEVADGKLEMRDLQLPSVEALIGEAAVERPEPHALQQGIAAQDAHISMVKADYFPSIAVATGVMFARAPNRDEQTNPFAWDEFNFVRPIFAIAIHWNMNFLLTHARVLEAHAELARLEAKREEAITGIELEVRRRYFALQQAKNTAIAAEDGSKAGRALMVSAMSNFDLGFGDVQDLFVALSSYGESHADYVHALHDYAVAIAELSRAVGRELEPLAY
jgi:outer membrane protein TolC